MTNNKQHIILLAVAAAWFAKPSYADKFTSTWTSNLIRPNSVMELDLHVQLNRKVYGHDRDMMADEQTFIGPGVMECNKAVCTFEVDESLGCADPCHTVSAPRMYEYPFYAFSDVGDPYYKGSSEAEEEEVCYYREATDITTWKPELAQIDKGCTAHCTGCTFASPVVPISGPTTLQCDDGRCTKYVHGETFGCGTDIEAASGAYGTLSTLPDGEYVPHEFHGFEGINGSFEIPDTCQLECTGCIALPNDSGTKTEGASTSTTSATTETETTSTSTTSTGTDSTSSTGTTSTSQTTTEKTTTSTTSAATEVTTGTDSTSSTGTDYTSPTTTENTSTRRTSVAAEVTTGTELTSSTGTEYTSPTSTENTTTRRTSVATEVTTGTELTSSTGTEYTSPTSTENTTTRRTTNAPESTGTAIATTGTELTSSTGIYLRGGTRRG